ncbi:MAG: hypothetical protein IJF40_07975 [Clostridia bacterium]|nr:hypothetical protein [Clostridia bacterium]
MYNKKLGKAVKISVRSWRCIEISGRHSNAGFSSPLCENKKKQGRVVNNG